MTGPRLFSQSDTARVFGIPVGLDFPKASLDGLLERLDGHPPEALARVEIYVNTARMQRRLKELLCETGRAGMLPQIKLLTDIGSADFALPPATPPLRRQLELSALVAELIAAAPDIAPRSALFDLSASLVRLLDECAGEGVSLDTLTALDVQDLSAHWDRALRFICIVAPFLDSAETPPGPQGRQRRAVLRQIARWDAAPPAHPILIVGSTGSRGTTALLMQAVARLPQGALILPGFDFDQPAAVWARMTDALLSEDHPQFRYARLLAALELRPETLPRWTEAVPPVAARNRLTSLALRPAPVTDQWRAEGPSLADIPEAMSGITLVEASSQREEALSIATALRAAAAENRHVALITPDRTLTRQVSAALDRWRIVPDDSAGKPLILSAPGRLLRHVAALIGTEMRAADLLVALKHPLTHSEHPARGTHLRHTRELELYLRAGTGLPVTPATLRDWAAKPPPGTKDADPSRAPWVAWVIETLFTLADTPAQAVADLEALHRARTEQLAAGPEAQGSGGLWDKEAGAQALKALDQLCEAADAGGTITPRDYAALLGTLLAAGEVRDPIQPDPRITVWGTLEARVQGADLVILAGLNEGVWPGLPDPDPWMNRRMRHEAGLLVPERQVGLSAHDFQQAFGTAEVILTRATRDSEAETVPSRWLNRLTNLLDGIGPAGQAALADARSRGQALVASAAQLDRPGAPEPLNPRPSPKVKRAQIRPRISASRVETLIRDPYQIYASDVLRLAPLPPLDIGPTPALRGTVFHEIMETALRTRPAEALFSEAHLIDTAEAVIAAQVPWPETALQWMARFASFAAPLATEERARQANATPVALEVRGATEFTNGMTLSCNADRIDRAEDGSVILYDYKTGQLPSDKQIDTLVKQLHLEAIIAAAGDFEDLPPLDVTRISYLKLNKGLGERSRALDPEAIGGARDAFVEILDGFLAGSRGYTARRMPRDLKHVSEYDHLSRFGEWDQTDLPDPGGDAMTAPDDASLAQMQAADPDYSVWLSANAGSGKTKVLTDRVARLLLEGVPPERILCLTYTKAAASEMQNRLFRTLGAWSMLEDADLRGKLGALGLLQTELTEDLCRVARTLFARAIETPGGLKIQTIHSFCAGLLRRFPLEAEVSPQFKEMDSRAEAELLQAVLRDMATGPEKAHLQAISRDIDEAVLPSLVQTLLKHRAQFDAAPDPGAIYQALDVDPDDSLDGLVARTLLPGDSDLLDRVATACAAGTSTDAKAAAKLRAVLALPEGAGWLEALEGVLLFGGKTKSPFGAKIDGFPTKATRAALGPDQDALNAVMARIEAARDTRLALGLAAMTARIHAFAHAFVRRYQAGKQARGWLDFDDLILRAQALLTDPGVAQWVLFRLDGGIDHMLVDEAQDTAPVQWEVIRLLTREFTAGQGARTDTQRTIFVVGDQKQSIYSFQGADPAGFDRMRGHFGTALAQVGTPLEEKLLLYSFRSSRAILQLVDQTFGLFAHRGLGSASQHLAFHPSLPGRVDLWPALPKSQVEEARSWTDPVDQPAQDDARLLLARKIAAEIRQMLDDGTQITTARGETRPVTPGDILILVQRRSEIFHELIRACKTENLPIAGSDRLRVGAELAVRDLMALLAFAATPEDSLSLACVLRSPLCGWGAAELHALAQPRKSPFLWAALRGDEAHAETVAFLQDIRDRSDFLRPYDLLDRVLTRHGGRQKLIARLGTEAEEGIDVLLAQALQYEQSEIPSLTGFVSWFRQDDMEIKRQIDARRDEIRVMTVHGAKGLEAPIVILPDCAKPRGTPGRTLMLPLPEGPLVWAGSDASRPRATQTVASEHKDRADDERMRLLYVALTRAESWLIVAAAGETGSGADSWHAMVEAGISDMDMALPVATPTGDGLRLSHGDWPLPGVESVPLQAAPTAIAPPSTPLAPPPPAPDRISPSRLEGAKVLSGGEEGRDKDAAMARGDRIHRLLEHLPALPRADWPAAAHALLGDAEDVADCLAEARSVLDADLLAPVFAMEALAEVELTAPLTSLGGAQMIGTVDRLLVSPDRVLAVDFKTNAVVPNTPDAVPLGLLRQMGAYAEALATIYADRRIETAILWTRTATLMPLPHKLVIEALQTKPPA